MIYSLFLCLASSLIVSASSVTVQNPPDDQFPLIARVGQLYSWSLQQNTFGPCDKLKYSVSPLPKWLSINLETLSFSGTPTEKDVGTIDVTLTAEGCDSSQSAWFDIPVKSEPPPSYHIPIADQFVPTNPSLSSVFIVSSNSALATGNPALRVPPKWSFSIGFESATFSFLGEANYNCLQADGSPLPDWMVFNPKELTLNGRCPHDLEYTPLKIPLALHASDERGYSASTAPFDLIVAGHDLTAISSPPTINITTDADLNVRLSSTDLLGILVDGQGISPGDIAELKIDVSDSPAWLKYDETNRIIAGHPPPSFANDRISMPVRLTTTFNQSLSTIVLLAQVAPYFTSSTLPTFSASNGGNVQFSILPYCSNTTSGEPIVLTTTFHPDELEQYLQFDTDTGQLKGEIPRNMAQVEKAVTFIAYDHSTHSTHHANLAIVDAPGPGDEGQKAYGTHLSPASRHKLVFGLGITFGILGGFCVLGVLLAFFRHCARVEDTAIQGEEGRSGWTEKDKKWYGLDEPRVQEGYGWTSPASEKRTSSFFHSPRSVPSDRDYGNIGLGLRRIQERSQSSESTNPGFPAVMSKREFMTRMKETVRNVSDRYNPLRKPPAALVRPIIGKPTLVSETPSPDSVTVKAHSPNGDSAQSLTSPPSVHVIANLPRQPSSDSLASCQAHADEAVVQTARALSIRSTKSASAVSERSFAISEPVPSVPPPRPTLVPFTSALRVPLPHTPTDEEPATSSKRITSQTAFVVTNNDIDLPKSTSNDELSMGLHYVYTLGDDRPANPVQSTLTVSTNLCSSFSSLPSSHDDAASHGGLGITRMLVRTGEQFKFRVPLRKDCSLTPIEKTKLEARLVTGESLPRFLHLDLYCPKYPGAVEFYGVPLSGEGGEFEIGLYTAEDICVARLSLEILERN